ncbi:SpoVR family protein [Candidatus Falkowbacteria bacterium RIFOXYB2_FULL_47_14]|uniref:SpoVR family protein n=1 Tax=Candidatus Falkowbacteria bacterium RIFOXYA2_FULL_47_19 TaxID=1797994 RepID=A0A1F5SMM1_9BACT|nr:MAG: SpoVR family protein [Candidatus Falkowbacteria bacterium RIFOXYA2_FULL_47_19]OGF36044.1 MAG: SpoVR family protein [Candidatus Falkowbacteria bacterium RIFOXYC2_FULL_46_15]OGF43434.1 MAG: SpoVR family protein [Candidatus Falkowbacteria bacterium RIFOXYB2_FULL_47_14]
MTKLIDQHTKGIMEECKKRAVDAGLDVNDETLEYIITNRDLVELSPKIMIPTLYDYWVHDIEVLQGRGKYELYPSNPYETVINTRPAISFYNDNNPDWLNVMIFYHVLGHIDFFRKNHYFRNTWDYDFCGEALSDKRLIANLRREHGRWVDYVIEFTRGMDNLVDYWGELSRTDSRETPKKLGKIDYFFDIFLQTIADFKNDNLRRQTYLKWIEEYNRTDGENAFLHAVNQVWPELPAKYTSYCKETTQPQKIDPIQYVIKNSQFLNQDKNSWMKAVMEVVRKTSVFFQPQIRTKIMNEGWASYWHEKLFLTDDRIRGHEVDFARINAGVTSMPRVGLNPYALGLRLFQWIEELGDTNKYSLKYRSLSDATEREKFNEQTGHGQEFIFKIRESLCDFSFLSTFVDQGFVTKNDLFVADRYLDEGRRVWVWYVKSRKAEDYRQMLFNSLYHPPHITVNEASEVGLCLKHHFEGKPLVKEFIHNTMLGIEFLWGGPVFLETNEAANIEELKDGTKRVTWQRVLYTMMSKKLKREVMS